MVTEQMSLDSGHKSCEKLPDLARQVGQMQARYKNMDRRLPKQQELGAFLKEISSDLAEAKLVNQSIEPGSPQREQLYHTLPIVMKFQGSYLSLAAFLKRIQDMERLTRVQTLIIGPNHEESRKTTDGDLSIELHLNIYFTES